MSVAIRVDGSEQIGMGHVTRCLALAQTLRAAGHPCVFVSRPRAEVQRLLQGQDFPVRAVAELRSPSDEAEVMRKATSHLPSPRVALTDLLSIDADFVRRLKEWSSAVVCVDDLVAVAGAPDLVVNCQPGIERGYYLAVPQRTARFLLGLRYLFMDAVFQRLRGRPRTTPERARRILVTMGGGGDRGTTQLVLRSLAASRWRFEVTVVLGFYGEPPGFRQAARLLSRHRLRVLAGVSNMPELLAQHDLAVTAGGTTKYHLACVGTPAVAIALEPHQDEQCRHFARRGSLTYAGFWEGVEVDALAHLIDDLADDRERREEMARRGRAAVDGLGCRRVVETIEARLSRGRAAD